MSGKPMSSKNLHIHADFFIIAKTRKQPRCPPASQWINKLWYSHTTEYYSMLKINCIKPWKDMEET